MTYVFRNYNGKQYRMSDEEWERQYNNLKVSSIIDIPELNEKEDYFYSHYESENGKN